METSVKAAKVSVPPQPDGVSPDTESTEGEVVAAACGSSSDFLDPMEEFSSRLEDIISSHGSAATLLDTQAVGGAEVEKMKEEEKDDSTVTMETEVSLIMQSLNNRSSPEEKLEDLVRKHAELAALRRIDEKKLAVVQQRVSVLLEERQQLQAEYRSSVTARSKLETLCRELQGHYRILTEETLQRCREDEEKRTEITSHFQKMLTEIQAQIEQHSARNDKLCHENTNLTDKLESLMNQCEQREVSLEKINRHRDLQHKLTEAKLQQANALLAEAEEKHKREKEYLLVQAAEWKLQAQTLREQATVMQAQLTLYAQKFDEFQETLAKSNEIYVRFKTEMENMSDKMKKLEKESNLWRIRFENCNKALTDMIEERTEKSKEYDLFVLKIQKLEKLCRALQDERKVLYDKIKEVRQANSDLPAKIFGSSKLKEDSESADKSELLTPAEIQELQAEDLVLTEDMARLREQQAKLREFADSFFAPVADNEQEDNNDIDPEEDLVASAFVQFKSKPQVKQEPVSVPEEQVVEVKLDVAEIDLPQSDKAKELQNPAVSTPEEKTPETIATDSEPEAVKVQPQVDVQEDQQVEPDEEILQQQKSTTEAEKVSPSPPTDLKPEAVKVQAQIENKEVQQVQPAEEIQEQQLAEQQPATESEKVNPQTAKQPEAAELKIEEETEVKSVAPVEDEKVQQQPTEPVQAAAEPATSSESTPPSETTGESSTKQAPKKKKKKGGKNAS
ncbi:beta-taxilin isoform X2 [Anabas testudineus]|uniref:Taxilin beta a n=1 Tax=Anabas testudineus TaxID=64144 RepID=A0AAQ6IIU9_ANATE|nr:beta-taxilin isoform X2 [Anabas testudineus]